MREAAFIKKNHKKWETFEEALHGRGKLDPDQLADFFIQITDDLAYAQTHFPESGTTRYLNNLASQVHQHIYTNKKERRNRFISFWFYELPLLFKQVRPQFYTSLVIFCLSMLIGIVSAAHDDTFVRLILGDDYVNMTQENIKQGEPMAVYKSMKGTDMFFAITFNNIRVALLAFAMGIIFSLGTGLILVQNGIMLGAFQYFFYEQGLFLTSFLTIWIHGTIEIASIVIAGGAGLVMGNSLLFPGTYPRKISFQQGASKGMKIVIGLIPLFIIAGFLESFVTRLTDIPWILKAAIIIGSAGFIIFYFFIYPEKLNQKYNGRTN